MTSDYYYSMQQQGIDRRTKAFVVRRCLAFLKGPTVLDLGFVDGMWTDRILEAGWTSDIVEGAQRHVDHARQHYVGNERVGIHHATFETFQPSRRYNSIIAGDILRYIAEPVTFLARLKDWLDV